MHKSEYKSNSTVTSISFTLKICMAHVIITLTHRWANLGVYKFSKNLGSQFHGENPQQLGNMKQNN